MTDPTTELKSTDPILKVKETKSQVQSTEPHKNTLIFDEKRLEISRKNRLATLLSALTGEPPKYLRYEKSKSTTVSESGATPTNSPHKLVSILSPQNKPKHDKHVTFNLPPEQKEITSIASFVASTAVTTTTVELLPILSSAQAVTTPSKDLITSNVETPKSAISAPAGIKLNFETNTSTMKEIVKVGESKTSESNLSNIVFKPSVTTENTTVSSTFAFGSTTSTTSSNITSLIPTTSVTTVSKESSSPTKSGGFKFDLGKPPSEVKSITNVSSSSAMTPKFNFGTTSSGETESSTSAVTKSITLPGFCMPQSSSVVTPTFAFGNNQSKPSSTQANDTTIATIPTNKNAGFGDIKFGNVTSPLNVISASDSMQSTPVVTTNPTNLFAFGATKQPALPSTQTTQSSNTATTFGGFGNLPAIAPATQTPAFGVTTVSTVPSFGVDFSNAAPASTNSSFGAFGTSATTASTAAIPSFAPTTTTSMFGNPTPSVASFTSPGLTTTSTITTFSTPTSSEKMFNPTTTGSSLFVTNPASQSFNATTTTTTASSGIFGAAPETKPFSFGSNQSNAGGNSSFNTPNTKSGFNFTSNTTPSSTSLKPVPSFGSPNVFGSSTSNANTGSNVFKSPSASNFGSTQFGSKSENTTFGSKVENQNTFGNFNNSFGAPTNATSGFGTNTNNNNNSNAFGAPTNTVVGFGTNTNNNNNSTNAFGTPANSTGGFGNTNSNNNNNNANAFGANPANNTFGANSNAFGANSNNKPFGSNTNNTFPITPNPTTGFTSTQNNFGQTPQNTNTFGAPPNNNANNSTFGSANMFGNPAASNTSNFGFTSGDNASAFSKPSAAAFGGATAAGDTPFQFGGGNAPAANQGFAGSATNATPSGGQSGVFAFGSPSQPAAPTGGVFTFGTAEAKPAFNFNAGSNAAPSFGAGAANFSPAPAQNAFNPPQFGGAVAGVFSIGSGSTTGPRNRNQLKGKRRV